MLNQQEVILTFDVEGLYGQTGEEIEKILGELRKSKAYATFFFVASYAQKLPEVAEKILEEGHEIGCHGLDHHTLIFLPKHEVKSKLKEGSTILTDLLKTSIHGFRAPNFAINVDIINLLEKLGFKYDSSVLPGLPIPGWYSFPRAPIYPYHPSLTRLERKNENRGLWEIPLAVFPQVRLPCFGGWWLRNIGRRWFFTGLKLLLKKGPAIVCLHDWEFLEPCNIKTPTQFKSPPSIPFLAFHNTGVYVAKTLKHLLRNYNSKVISVEIAIEKGLIEGA